MTPPLSISFLLRSIHLTETLLLQPLLNERTSILRLQTLWITPLTPKHILPFHFQSAKDIASCVSGKPPKPVALHWLPVEIMHSSQGHEDLDNNIDPDPDDWDDIPLLDPSQEILADVITEDCPLEQSIESVWAPSVWHFTQYSEV